MDRHDAFIELYLRHQHDVRAFVASVIRDWHRAEDVVQEVARVLWQRFDDYDPGRPFGAWARGVAANLVMKDGDRQRRAPPSLSPAAIEAVLAAYEAEPEPEPTRTQEALRECLGRLPAPARRLIAWRYADALGIAALCERTGGSVAAIKKALVRLRARLHDCVSDRLARTDRG